MITAQEIFEKKAEKVAFDLEHRRKINYNISRYNDAVIKGKEQYTQLELAKERAANRKSKVINDLDKYLIEFETNFTRKGGKVIWAENSAEAIWEIIRIFSKNDISRVVKSKSMITEEIDLNEQLEKNNIESLETDLGEYIVQLDHDKPYHIITPAMHKSKEDIAELFNSKFNIPIESTPEEITSFVRGLLREKFITANAGVTGVNFLIADIGAVAITENEGNALMSVSFPKIHIAIAGIEKIIPSLEDLHIFWPLLATHGTGQNITVYNSILSGPRQKGEKDGPEEMYVILLDNGRSTLLGKKEQRSALTCIRCGACLNACPVYKNIGGHTYATTYSGPIGAVISPHFLGMEKYRHLSFASSLCGKCSEVCPVKINLHELLLLNRNESVKEGYYKNMDKWSMWGWKKIMLKRKYMDMGTSGLKNFMLNKFFKKTWGSRRQLPMISEKSFKQLWQEQHPHHKS